MINNLKIFSRFFLEFVVDIILQGAHISHDCSLNAH